MFKKSLVLAGLCSVLAFCQNVNAQSIALADLQDLPSAVNAVDQKGEIKQDHWVYKTLENITKRVNTERFDINKPLTRDEAAIILVSIVREIEKGKIEINEAEKIQLNILRNEFKNEARCLQGRIQALETNNNKLEARVSKLEKEQGTVKDAWSHRFGDKFKLSGFAQGRFTSNIRNTGDNGFGFPNDPSNFSIPSARVRMSGKLHENIEYKTSFDLGNDTAGFANLVDAYVTTNVLDNHQLLFGQSRVPIGKEGTTNVPDLDFIYRSQIATQFSDFRDVGVKITGDYGFVTYDAGVFNGNLRNTADNNDDLTYGARVQFNPLINRSDKGELNIGGGYFIGRDNRSIDLSGPNGKTLSLFGSYKINKYEASVEFGRRDNYLQEGRNADGIVLSNTYYINDKTQLLARYDRFDPDTSAGDDRRNRYVAGVNYYFAKHLKLMANFVHEQRKAQKDAQQLVFQTQYRF